MPTRSTIHFFFFFFLCLVTTFEELFWEKSCKLGSKKLSGTYTLIMNNKANKSSAKEILLSLVIYLTVDKFLI